MQIYLFAVGLDCELKNALFWTIGCSSSFGETEQGIDALNRWRPIHKKLVLYIMKSIVMAGRTEYDSGKAMDLLKMV